MNLHDILLGFITLTPELTLMVGAIILLLVGVIFPRISPSCISFLSAILILVAAFSIFPLDELRNFSYHEIYKVQNAEHITLLSWNRAILFDKMSYYLNKVDIRFFILCLGFFAMLNMAKVMSYRDDIRYEIPILTLFALAGMSLMTCSGDLLTLYIALEIVAISFYICIAFDKRDYNANEAGLKYFVLSSVASGIYLFGVSLVYLSKSTISFATIPLNSTILDFHIGLTGTGNHIMETLFLLGVAMIFVTFAFKLMMFPFHVWGPDVYQGANVSVVASIATVSKFAAAFVFLRLFFIVFAEASLYIKQFVVWLSLASIAIGTFAAVKQDDLKRLIAYSGVAHIGFGFVVYLLDFGNDDYIMKQKLIDIVLLYVGVYSIITLGLFIAIAMLHHVNKHLNEKKFEVINSLPIESLAGLATKSPFVSAVIAISMFSLAGIPPFAGFFTKLIVLIEVIKSADYMIAIYFVLMTVVSCYYYLRVVKIMYFDQGAALSVQSFHKSTTFYLLITLFALFNILFGLFFF